MAIISWLSLGILAGFFLRKLCQQADSAGMIPSISVAGRIIFKLTVLLLSILVAVVVAFGQDYLLLNYIPDIFILPYAPRAKTLFIGIFVGFAIAIYADQIFAVSSRVFDAFITGSSWIFTLSLSILIVILALLAINPDVASKLSSIKLSSFEAKFVQTSSNTANAKSNYTAIDIKTTLRQWEDFDTFYVSDSSTRAKAMKLYSGYNDEEVDRRRRQIKILWGNYMNVMVKSFNCLEENFALEQARHHPASMQIATAWNSFIVNFKVLSSNAEKQVEKLISNTALYVEKLAALARDNGRDCEIHYQVDSNREAKASSDFWSTLISLPDKNKTHAIDVFDTYLIGTVADMISFSYGPREKVNFLLAILADRAEKIAAATPTDPGLINIHYALSDAMFLGEATWPLNEAIEHLEASLRGADKIFSLASSEASGAGPNESEGKGDIAQAYLINRYYFFGRMLDTYNQRALKGDMISADHKRRWLRAIRILLSINYLRPIGAPPPTFRGAQITLTGEEGNAWRHVRAPSASKQKGVPFAEQEWSTSNAIALSAILSAGQGGASADDCGLAERYLERASETMPVYIDQAGLRAGEQATLRHYQAVIQNQVHESCH
jgi:hypothetical protein